MSLISRFCTKNLPLSQCRQISRRQINGWTSPLKKFQQALDEKPFLTNTMIGGFFMCAGDLTQQLYFNPCIKWREVAAYSSIGFAFGGVGMVWYKWLDKCFPGIATMTIIKKMIIDEVAWGPVFIATVFYALPLMETQDHEYALKELKSKFLSAWIGSAGFWLAFQSINFRFVPSKYRMTYLLAISFVFDTAIAVYRYQY